MSNKQIAWLIARALGVGASAFIVGGLALVTFCAFLFLFFAVGNEFNKRCAAERLAASEAGRALQFQQYAVRRHRRLMRYRRATRERMNALYTIIATQDSIAQIKTRQGKIHSLMIDGVLFMPAGRDNQPQVRGQGTPDDFDFPETIGGE